MIAFLAFQSRWPQTRVYFLSPWLVDLEYQLLTRVVGWTPLAGFVLVTLPFHRVVTHVNAALALEQVAGMLETFWDTCLDRESKEGGKC